MKTLKSLNRETTGIDNAYPERIVQFGAGNFLRAFIDWIIEELNEQCDFASSAVVVKVTPRGTYQTLDEQDGLFHVHLQGIQDGEFVSTFNLIRCISRTVYPYVDYDAYLELARQPEIRFLISNTTEAGIQYDVDCQFDDKPPASFPAKLTRFLYERYQHFQGAADKGCIIIPTELIPDNGSQLREMILRHAEQWELESDFSVWIEQHNIFCNTLVDRIVTGFPHEQSEQLKNEIGYDDQLLVMAEPYHSMIIEAPENLLRELPISESTLNIKIVPDANPYRETKVRILNGLHTSMVPIGFLLGLQTVRECIEHKALEPFLQDELYQEIIPSMAIPEGDLKQFAAAVFDRFRNPSIRHELLSIAVNSSSKVRTRLLPSIQGYYQKYQQIPPRLTLALACFIRFYKGEWQGESIALSDDDTTLMWFTELWDSSNSIEQVVDAVLQNVSLWQMDLSDIGGLREQLLHYLEQIDESGVLPILEQVNGLDS